MATQRFEVLATSAAPPEKVFAVLADRTRWHEWAGPMIRSSSWERTGDAEPGGVGAIGRLGSSRFYSREEIVEYDPPHHLAYVMLSGQPVRDYRATVDLSPADGGTAIAWRATFEPKIPGTGALLKLQLRTIVASFAKRLAVHATSR